MTQNVLGILIILALLGFLGFPLAKLGAIKIPKWAKIQPKKTWKIKFFDDHLWLKWILIRPGQLVLLGALFLINLFKLSFSLAMKIMLPKGLKKL